MPTISSPIGTIGGRDNPFEQQLRNQLGALSGLGPLAERFSSALGRFGPQGGGFAEDMLRDAIPRLLSGGMSEAEEAVSRRSIGSAFRSATGAGGFAGGAGGAFSPRATRRVAFREAGRRLAPAIASFEAKKAERRRRGLESGVGALTSIYGPQLQAQSSERRSFGRLLGGLLGGVRSPRAPTDLTYIPQRSFGF